MELKQFGANECLKSLYFVFLQNSGVHIRSEYMYDMKDVWSKIQAVVRELILY